MTSTQTNSEKIGKPPAAKGFKHLIRSCGYSAAGFKAACGEAAFRQELAFGVILVPLAWLAPISATQAIGLNICWLILLLTELLNTAIEAVVDMTSPNFHPLAKKAKDIASAAVTCAILINAVAWLPTFYMWYKH